MKKVATIICLLLGFAGLCRSSISEHDDADVLLATGNASSKSQLSTRRDRYCNPTNLAPNLPHGPYLCGFPNQNVYNAAAVGVLDAYTLAMAALRVLDRCGQTGEEASLTRYFDIGTPGVRETVFRVFNYLVGPEGLGTPMMLNPDGYDLEIWYHHGSPDNLLFEHPASCDTMPVNAYFTQFMTDNRRAWIVLCPNLLASAPPTLESVACDTLDSVASIKMNAVGASILHEFMHWGRYTEAIVGMNILDWNHQKDPNLDPPSGYGPYHAQILQEEHEGAAISNADNYKWFALEAYFSERCDREFEEQYQHDERNDQPGDNNQITG